MALEESLILKIQADDAELTVGELKQGIKDLNKELLNVQKGSERYNELVHTLGKARGEFFDLREEAKAYNPEARAAAFARVGNALAGGFQFATGAMALFGTESKDVEKALLKVQAATAMAMGVQSIMELGKAFNVLRTIILANPIIAIAAVITAVSIAVVGLFRDTEDLAEQQKKLNEETEKSNELFDIEERRLRALGVAEKELIERRRENLQSQLETLRIGLVAQRLTLAQAQDEFKASRKSKLGNTVAGTWWRMLFGTDEGDISAADQLVKETELSAKELETLILESSKKISDIDKKAAEDAAKRADEKRKKDEEEAKKNIRDKNEQFKFEEDAFKWEQENELALLKHYSGLAKQEDEEKAKAKEEAAKKEEAINKRLTKSLETDLEAITEKNIESIEKIEKAKLAQKEKDAFFRDIVFQAEQALFTSLSAMQEARFNREFAAADGNEKKQEQLRKEFFEKQKRLQIAQALMATYQAGVNAFNATAANVGLTAATFGIAPYIAAAAAIASGLANVAQIKSQSYQGGASAGGIPSASVPPVPGGGGGTTSSQTVTTTATATQTNANQEFTGFGQKTIKAYVVETEITDSQNKITKIKDAATFP